IRSEWRVDEAISAVDGRREAPGSGTNEQLPACETGSGDRNSAAPVVQLAEGFKEAGASGFLARCVAQNRGSTPAQQRLRRDCIYEHIQVMQPATHLSIESMCGLGQVSRAGFYR